MKLEELRTRSTELDNAITNATRNIYVLQGHKAEVEFMIGELVKAEEAVEEAEKEVEVADEAPVE